MTAPGNRANGPGLGPPTEEADMTEASKALRTMSPAEAEPYIDAFRMTGWETGANLAHTVATEPERIAEAERRGAVKALRAMAEQSYNYDDANHLADALDRRASAIENGADL